MMSTRSRNLSSPSSAAADPLNESSSARCAFAAVRSVSASVLAARPEAGISMCPALLMVSRTVHLVLRPLSNRDGDTNKGVTRAWSMTSLGLPAQTPQTSFGDYGIRVVLIIGRISKGLSIIRRRQTGTIRLAIVDRLDGQPLCDAFLTEGAREKLEMGTF